MTLAERIRTYRQQAGLSQDKLAEQVGVSRQAVTKWEAGQTAPSTENLFRLAEALGVTVGRLTGREEPALPAAETVAALYRQERERDNAARSRACKSRLRDALLTAAAYLAFFLLCKALLCDFDGHSLLGWLTDWHSDSYLFGWLLSSRLYWAAMAVSVLAAAFGRRRLAAATLLAAMLGIPLGEKFGVYEAGIPYGHGHYGWAIWGGLLLVSIIAGLFWERRKK
ncbi:MAG: helix-turn-helix domain-containing protein [Agathobaculum sp.]|jgi:transcriptional regulator with XRE-family HTH domain|uniref:helix-turn-helix domain-containing protein n=1 Tax=Agathobaculum sp. TaxID=2048138 RepID=UPI003D8C5411